jgi:hypothetical protein
MRASQTSSGQPALWIRLRVIIATFCKNFSLDIMKSAALRGMLFVGGIA